MPFRFVIMTCLLAAAPFSYGADYCVSTTDELSAAVGAAAADTNPSIIKLRSGDYVENIVYSQQNTGSNLPGIEMSGGWDAACEQPESGQTRIVGNVAFTGVQEFPHYPVVLSHLMVTGELATRTWSAVEIRDVQSVGGLDIGCCAGPLAIERSAFFGEVVDIATSGHGASILRNNVFAGALGNFDWFDQSDGEGSVTLRGNTFHFTHGRGGGIIVFAVKTHREPAAFEFSRNLMTHAEANAVLFQIDLDDDDDFIEPPFTAADNWIGFEAGRLTLTPPDMLAGNGNVVGEFPLPYRNADDPSDVHLRSGSPMIDYSEPDALDLDDFDMDGHPRIFDGRVDVGAYEALGIFRSGFDD